MLILSTPQGAAAEGRGPCYVHYISMSGRGGQIDQIYHDLLFKAKYLQYRGLVKLGTWILNPAPWGTWLWELHSPLKKIWS